MDFTPFYVTDGASTSPNNAGGPRADANGGALSADNADSNEAEQSVLTRVGESPWNAQVGDFARWDPGGANDKLGRVIDDDVLGDGTQIQVDRTFVGSGKECRIAGFWDDPETPAALIDESHVNADGDPPKVWIKAGTYNLTGSFSPANNGTRLTPIHWEGYTTTPGDATVPVVTLQHASQDVISLDKAFHVLRGFSVTGNAASAYKQGIYLSTNAIHCVIDLCRVYDVGWRGIGSYAYGALLTRLECSGWGQSTSGAHGIYLNHQTQILKGAYLHDATGNSQLGVCLPKPMTHPPSDIIVANVAGAGVRFEAMIEELLIGIVRSIVYGCGGSGIEIDHASEPQSVIVDGCILVNNGGYGIGRPNALGRLTLMGAAFHGNTSGEVQGTDGLAEPIARITIGSNPFVDAANGDFRLKPEMTNLVGAGWPANFLSGGALTEWASRPDVGPVQQVVRPVVSPFAVRGL